MSVSTTTEKNLSASPCNDVRALGTPTPGMVLSNPSGFNAAGGGMRGTGTNIILVTQDAPVSFLADEFPLNHVTSQFFNLFDVQQVEVFRGPQGTLFDKNTTGGVIALTSKEPVLGEHVDAPCQLILFELYSILPGGMRSHSHAVLENENLRAFHPITQSLGTANE